MPNQDTSYKLLFAHPRMVRDLVRGFFPPHHRLQLELDQLERLPANQVTEDLRERRNDMVWRLTDTRGDRGLHLILEFQTTVDRWMAARTYSYASLLYADLIRGRRLRPSEQLTTIVPVVLYNGPRWWSAAHSMAELVEPTPGFERFRPQLPYLLIDPVRFDETELAVDDNAVALLFRLERARSTEEIERLLGELAGLEAIRQDHGLERAFIRWLRQVLWPKQRPHQEWPDIHSLKELYAMSRLQHTVSGWLDQSKQQGMHQGMRQGMRQGIHEGEERVLTRLLERRFGALPATLRERLAAASHEELLLWSERVLDAESLDEVFT